ncbi:MAG: hypothetical protein GY853_09130 [PVC group bacterium]|nr:hypothetical protein [PVC group bacterium]
MKIKQESWSIEEARKKVKIASILVILNGVIGLIMSADDFVALGANTSIFVFPYFFNTILFLLSAFQIYVGIILKDLKQWSRLAVYGILALRIILVYFDWAEAFLTIAMLSYVVHVLRKGKAGWLFQAN